MWIITSKLYGIYLWKYTDACMTLRRCVMNMEDNSCFFGLWITYVTFFWMAFWRGIRVLWTLFLVSHCILTYQTIEMIIPQSGNTAFSNHPIRVIDNQTTTQTAHKPGPIILFPRCIYWRLLPVRTYLSGTLQLVFGALSWPYKVFAYFGLGWCIFPGS